MPEKILVAENETSLRVLYSRVLSKAGYAVSTAPSCAEALRLAGGTDFALVVTDLYLDDGLGTGLVDSLKESGCRAKTVLMSGEAGPAALAEMADRHGINAFFEKSTDVFRLVDMVGGLLRED
ncbi:MAG: response regulator [Elusimicrobiota bacterium]